VVRRFGCAAKHRRVFEVTGGEVPVYFLIGRERQPVSSRRGRSACSCNCGAAGLPPIPEWLSDTCCRAQLDPRVGVMFC
jgi:hypothetical protein